MNNPRKFLESIQKPFIIAEIAQAHDGSLGMAHAFIDAVAGTGVDAIKFQTHIAEEESTLQEPFRIKFSKQDTTRFEYWRRMEFTKQQWFDLADHAKQKGLFFLSSAFSVPAVELLNDLDVPAWKVGSGEFKSFRLLDVMINTGKPIMISTGMSCWEEIDAVVNYLKSRSASFVLFQCTSEYPTPINHVGLNIIDELKTRYACPVGLSDHSGKVFAPLCALARGIDFLEVHVTFDKRMFGPDVSSSITIDELKFLKDARDEFHAMDINPVDKNQLAADLASTRKLFTKSIAPSRHLKKHEIIDETMISEKKPGTGISWEERNKVIGKRLAHDVPVNTLLKWDDFE